MTEPRITAEHIRRAARKLDAGRVRRRMLVLLTALVMDAFALGWILGALLPPAGPWGGVPLGVCAVALGWTIGAAVVLRRTR
jgi:hypothetical protein